MSDLRGFRETVREHRRILAPAVAALSAGELQEALSQGRNQPLPATIAHSLAELTRPEAS